MLNKLFVKIGIFLALFLGLLTANTASAASFVGYPSVNLSNSKAGEISNYKIDFISSASGALTSGDQIDIEFPAGFNLAGANLSNATGFVGTVSYSINGQNVTLTLDPGTTLAADTAVSVNLSGIINHQITGTQYQLIVTSTHLGAIVDGPTTTGYFSVLPNAPNQAQSTIETAGDTTTMVVGSTLNIEFDLRDQYGNAIAAEDVAWTRSNANFAISTNNNVTDANGKSSITLTAPTTAGAQTTVSAQSGTVVHNITVTTQAISTVHDVATAVTIAPTGPLTMTADDAQAFTATAQDQYGNTWDVTNDVTWQENDPMGSFTGTTYYAGQVGAWTINATYGALTSNDVTANVSRGNIVSIDVTGASDTITAGQTATYTVSAIDADGNTWDITNDTNYIITNEANGSWTNNVYTSQTAGDWVITATYLTFSDHVNLKVNPGSLHHIDITPDTTQNIVAGDDVQFSANGFDEFDNIISGLTFDWDNTDNTGLFTNRIMGTYDVCAHNGLVNSNIVRVNVDHNITTQININPNVNQTIKAGDSIQFSATAQDQYGNITNDDLAWTATDENGLFTNTVANVYQVKACAGLIYSTDIQVTVGHADVIDHLVISPTNITLTHAGNTQDYLVTAYDEYGNSWDVTTGTSFTISASDLTGIFTDNMYKGGTIGVHTITASYLGKTISTNVTVATPGTTVGSIEIINKISSVTVGGSHQYQVRVKDLYGNLITGQVVTWSISGDNSATIDSNGLLTGTAAGNINVRATIGTKYSEDSVEVVALGGVGGFTTDTSSLLPTQNNVFRQISYSNLASDFSENTGKQSVDEQITTVTDKIGKISAINTQENNTKEKFPYLSLILIITGIAVIYLFYNSLSSNPHNSKLV